MSSAFIEMLMSRWYHGKAEPPQAPNLYSIAKSEERRTNTE
jgi:hypothetical protein